MLNIVFFGTL